MRPLPKQFLILLHDYMVIWTASRAANYDHPSCGAKLTVLRFTLILFSPHRPKCFI